MLVRKLDEMTKGWFVGNFNPSVYKTEEVEVGVKHYKAGDSEDWHYHKIATEITLVVSGTIEMCGKTFTAGDIVILSPGEGTTFKASTDAVNVVVKLPGAVNDKYLK